MAWDDPEPVMPVDPHDCDECHRSLTGLCRGHRELEGRLLDAARTKRAVARRDGFLRRQRRERGD
jgi:hypothetical protein